MCSFFISSSFSSLELVFGSSSSLLRALVSDFFHCLFLRLWHVSSIGHCETSNSFFSSLSLSLEIVTLPGVPDNEDPGEIQSPRVHLSPVGAAAYCPVCKGTIFQEHKGLVQEYSILNCQPILESAGWACGRATGGGLENFY